MIRKSKYLLKLYLKIRKFKLDNRFFIFLFFSIVATVFWFLNALSKEYTHSLSFPIEFTDIPNNKLLIGNTNGTIKLKVTAYGFDLLKHNLKKSITPLHISLSSAQLHRKSRRDSSFYILSIQEKNSFSSQLEEIKIISIQPDTLPLKLATIIKKTVAVVPDLDITFGQQNALKNNIQVIPDSIIVYGPSVMMDTIKSLKTKKITLKDITKSLSIDTKIEPIKNIKLPTGTINVNIPVEKYTEESFELKIDKLNVPKNVSLKTFPTKVTIRYHVGLSKNHKNDDEKFKVAVDYKQIEESSIPPRTLKVFVVSTADSIIEHSLRFAPTRVDYLIEK